MSSSYDEVCTTRHPPLAASDKILSWKTDVGIRYTYRLYTLPLNKLEYRSVKTTSVCKQLRKYAFDLMHACVRVYVTQYNARNPVNDLISGQMGL
jgi:hypothetical protein